MNQNEETPDKFKIKQVKLIAKRPATVIREGRFESDLKESGNTVQRFSGCQFCNISIAAGSSSTKSKGHAP